MDRPLEQTASLNDISVPTFLYGTAWKEDATQRCVRDALDAGFRGLDTANQPKHYYEAGVGAALREAYDAGTVTREGVFLQTKFTDRLGQDHRLPYDANADFRTQVMQSFASSLEHLRTDYIDSYVLHGPSRRHGIAEQDWAVWRAMEELRQSGKVKLLGVSNVAIDQLRILCQGCAVKPNFVQNRCFASMNWDHEVRRFCAENDIRYQGFSLLTANTAVLQHPRFKEIVSRYGCSPAQLVFCFALQANMIPLTGTTKPAHMREDLAAYGLKLDVQDMRLIEFISEK